MGAFALMLFTSGVLLFIGALMHSVWDDQAPGWAVGLYAAVLFGGAVATTWSFVWAGGLGVLLVRFSLVIFVWIPTFYVFSKLVTAPLSRRMAYGLYFGSSLHGLSPSSHGRARALLMKGDGPGARAVFLEEYRENPKSPEPLMAGGWLLTGAGHNEAAAELYRKAMRDFERVEEVWVAAAWHLSILLEERMQGGAEAAALRRLIVRRAPRSEVGKMAAARLRQASNPMETEC